jgi:diguanylate cyclase (GGDEF)-like protein
MGRYGGEEFLIIFPGWDFQISPSRTDELLDAIRSQPFRIDEGEIKVTCSLGVAVFRPSRGTDDFRELLRRADAALYVAKNSGRNQASFEVRSSGLANTGNDELTGSAEFLR